MKFKDRVIFIKPEFSGDGMEHAYRPCLDIIKQLQEEFIPKRKIAKLKQFILTIKQEVRAYQ